jgi:hypothetical protein
MDDIFVAHQSISTSHFSHRVNVKQGLHIEVMFSRPFIYFFIFKMVWAVFILIAKQDI